MPETLAVASVVIGWAYMLCWSAASYPMIISNFQRRSTSGISRDYCLLNLLSSATYTIYNFTLSYSSVVRQQFKDRHPENPTPAVAVNDVAYAVHGFILSLVLNSQFYPSLWKFEGSGPRRISRWCVMVCWTCILGTGLGALGAYMRPDSGRWQWLDVIYLVGIFKSFLTTLKYTPQAWMNYQRKSTQGLPMTPFILDMAGALLSLLQLLLDSAYHGNQAVAMSNPVKLVLSYVSMVFDVTFCVQHYILYPETEEAAEEEAKGGLLADAA